jgi:hypothetical protein
VNPISRSVQVPSTIATLLFLVIKWFNLSNKRKKGVWGFAPGRALLPSPPKHFQFNDVDLLSTLLLDSAKPSIAFITGL